MQRLLTAEEVARALGISRATCYPLLSNGTIRSVRIGRSRRVATEDVEDFITRLRQTDDPAVPNAKNAARSTGGAPEVADGSSRPSTRS